MSRTNKPKKKINRFVLFLITDCCRNLKYVFKNKDNNTSNYNHLRCYKILFGTLIIPMIICFAGYYISNLPSIQKKYYKDGSFKKEIVYDNGSIVKEIYYKDGTLKTQEIYTQGKLNGVAISYYENGKLEAEVPFKNDKKHGVVKHYYQNGGIESEITFDDGIQSGSVKLYKENGELLARFIDGKDLLKESIEEGNLEQIHYWINLFAYDNDIVERITINDESSIFHLLKKNPDKVAEIMSFTSTVNKINKKGVSLLSYAVIKGNNKLLDYLLDKDINIDYIDRKGRTAIMYAAIKNNIYAAKKLVKKGADLQASKDGKWTAYKYAKDLKHKKIAALLKQDFDEIIWFGDDCSSCKKRKKTFATIVAKYPGLKVRYESAYNIGDYIYAETKYNPVILVRNSKTGKGMYIESWNGEAKDIKKFMVKN